MEKLAALGQRGPAHQTHVALHQVTLDMKDEFKRALKKHGIARTPANPEQAGGVNLSILVEEVGEVARAMTYDEGSKDDLEAELIQVAAMAAAWVVGLRMKRLQTEGV